MPQPCDRAAPAPHDRSVATEYDERFAFVGSFEHPRDQARRDAVEVVAVSEPLVIGVYLGGRYKDEHLTPFGKAWLQKAAAIAGPLLVPTMQRLLDPAFRPLQGGGGRVYAVVTNTQGAAGTATWGVTGDLQSECPLASEMTTVAVGDQYQNRTDAMTMNMASIIIHEYAHNADWIAALRMNGTSTRF